MTAVKRGFPDNNFQHWLNNPSFAQTSAVGDAYTQTYATASRVHTAATAAVLSMTDGVGTNDNAIGAVTGDASVIAALQEIVDEINKLVADVLLVKKIVNALVDDHQAFGICTP